jgi:DNA ligase (NAD+)
MDIEGVGPALVEQLVDKGLVSTPADLYSLTQDKLLTLDGVAERSSRNILHAIEQSKGREFDRVLFALGIRHIGRTTASEIAAALGSIDKLSSAKVEELSGVPGIGPVVASSLRDFFDNRSNRCLIEGLRKAGLRMQAEGRHGGVLQGKSFIFTGELESMTRSEAEKIVESLGGRISSGVTKATDYVVVGENPGSKLAKAKSLNKTIIDEKEFLSLIKRKG